MKIEGTLPVVGWRLYYGDGSVVSHLDCSWADAPSENVQVLEQLHDPAPYRTLTYGDDEYRLTPDSEVKFGAWMDAADFEALVDRVLRG